MARLSLLLLFLCLLSYNAEAQRHVVGSGDLVTQARDHDGFSRLEIQGAIKATVRQGSRFQVSIEADDNAIGLVESSVSGNRLIIKMADRVSTNKVTVRATITMPSLEAVKVRGASRMLVSGFNERGKPFKGDVSGASYLEINDASAGNLSLDASGASTVELSGFRVAKADINISGASTAKISVGELVTGKASGASSVRVSGGATIDVQTSGASRIR